MARAGGYSDGGSGREQGLRCRALAAAAAQGAGNGLALSSERGGEAVGIMTKKMSPPPPPPPPPPPL